MPFTGSIDEIILHSAFSLKMHQQFFFQGYGYRKSTVNCKASVLAGSYGNQSMLSQPIVREHQPKIR